MHFLNTKGERSHLFITAGVTAEVPASHLSPDVLTTSAAKDTMNLGSHGESERPQEAKRKPVEENSGPEIEPGANAVDAQVQPSLPTSVLSSRCCIPPHPPQLAQLCRSGRQFCFQIPILSPALSERDPKEAPTPTDQDREMMQLDSIQVEAFASIEERTKSRRTPQSTDVFAFDEDPTTPPRPTLFGSTPPGTNLNTVLGACGRVDEKGDHQEADYPADPRCAQDTAAHKKRKVSQTDGAKVCAPVVRKRQLSHLWDTLQQKYNLPDFVRELCERHKFFTVAVTRHQKR